MPDHLTDADLTRLLALDAERTPGEWVADNRCGAAALYVGPKVNCFDEIEMLIFHKSQRLDAQEEKDWLAMAAAVNHFAPLAREVQRLRAELARAVTPLLSESDLIDQANANMVTHRNAAIASRKRAEAAEAECEKLRGVIAQHSLCHDLHGRVNATDFAHGCATEQRRIYGVAPDADRADKAEADCARLRNLAWQLKVRADMADTYKQHLDDAGKVIGCDHSHDGLARCMRDVVDRAELTEAVLRALACELAVGGYNSESFDAEAFGARIRDGIQTLVRPLQDRVREMEAERDRLRTSNHALAGDRDRQRARADAAEVWVVERDRIAAEAIDVWRQRVTAAEKERDAARAALRPFADIARPDDHRPDWEAVVACHVYGVNGPGDHKGATLGDCRHAARVMKEGEQR